MKVTHSYNMYGPGRRAWHEAHAPMLPVPGVTDEGWGFVPGLMLWAKKHQCKVQQELRSLCVNTNDVSWGWVCLCSPGVACVEERGSRFLFCSRNGSLLVLVFRAYCTFYYGSDKTLQLETTKIEVPIQKQTKSQKKGPMTLNSADW